MVKKRTRHALQHIVVILINTQILVYKLLGLHAHVFGNTLNVGQGKQRARSLAAVGTGKAVGTLKLTVVNVLHYIIQVFGRLLFKLVKKLFVFVMLIFGELAKLF